MGCAFLRETTRPNREKERAESSTATDGGASADGSAERRWCFIFISMF